MGGLDSRPYDDMVWKAQQEGMKIVRCPICGNMVKVPLRITVRRCNDHVNHASKSKYSQYAL